MKIRKAKKKYPYVIVMIIIITIVLFGTVLFFTNKNLQKKVENSNNSSINLNPPTEEQKKAGEDIKKTQIDKTTNNELGLYFSSVEQSEGLLKIRIDINGAISNEGICTLKLQKNNQLLEYTTPTFALNSNSTCQGFDVDTNLMDSGNWQATLSVKINEKTSTINRDVVVD